MDLAKTTGTGAIVELRRYTLQPGARETLIELFDRAFVEAQEACGMHVLGQFRDIDDPDSFVWLRGFSDMESRAQALANFYNGPVWVEHRDDANATMVNSDDVLLLRTAAGERLWNRKRPANGAAPEPTGVIECITCHLKPDGGDDFDLFFLSAIRPELERSGPIDIVASFQSERATNTFPRLPIREGETVFVWLARHRDLAAYATHVDRLAGAESWTKKVLPEMRRRTWRKNHVARLAPTLRSAIR
ncbi:MAG: NIPSNAP family protein [Telmatospirillum sp.]|nr:NIPSNAP family protein [Telmatospirillum sp.]